MGGGKNANKALSRKNEKYYNMAKAQGFRFVHKRSLACFIITAKMQCTNCIKPDPTANKSKGNKESCVSCFGVSPASDGAYTLIVVVNVIAPPWSHTIACV
jgi:hypothetical protein